MLGAWTFLRTFGGGILLKVIAGLAIAGMIWFAVAKYNDGIRDAERQRNQIAQYEQVIKDNNELRIKLDELEKRSEEILEETDKKNEVVAERHNKVDRYIQSPPAQQSNRESSTVLKETIRMLNNDE